MTARALFHDVGYRLLDEIRIENAFEVFNNNFTLNLHGTRA